MEFFRPLLRTFFEFIDSVEEWTKNYIEEFLCSNLSSSCLKNETCFDYLYYCSVKCPAGKTNSTTLNDEIETYCLLNCLWRYRNASTILESYLNCLMNGTNLTILYEYCFDYWDTCTNTTACLATFISCNTTECYQNNTVAEETYECYVEEENSENGVANILSGKWTVFGTLIMIYFVFIE